MISHALIIRDRQRRDLLDEAAREQLVDQHYPPTSFKVSRLHQPLGQVVRRTLTEALSSRVAPRVASQG